ncbi:MAG TPA: DinB family protein [Bryobacteraceae bacterium]|nr:DinB family protein [Bryobacteraceae bacterium]
MLTDKERESAINRLTRSRQTLLDAVEGVTELQARWKPAPDRWSILEYVEHLAVSDDALIQLIRRSLETAAQPETEEQRKAREQKIRETPMPRGVNRAPEMLQPAGQFKSLAEALAAFLAARERTIEFARTTEDDLRSHFSPHTVLGPLDGYQWLTGNAHHAETHAGHIREIRERADFPK